MKIKDENEKMKQSLGVDASKDYCDSEIVIDDDNTEHSDKPKEVVINKWRSEFSVVEASWESDVHKTHKTFVSYEVASLLKENGFNWRCEEAYNTSFRTDITILNLPCEDWNHCNCDGLKIKNVFGEYIEFKPISCPTTEVAHKWLREEKNCIIQVSHWGKERFKVTINEYYCNSNSYSVTYSNEYCKTWDEAMDTGMRVYLDRLLHGNSLHTIKSINHDVVFGYKS